MKRFSIKHAKKNVIKKKTNNKWQEYIKKKKTIHCETNERNDRQSKQNTVCLLVWMTVKMLFTFRFYKGNNG